MEKGIKRKLTAILSADVAGYSRLMSDDEVATVRTLQDYRKTISELVHKHNGRVVDSPGDNLMAEFASVVDSVECAIEIQDVLRSKNDELPENRKMMFRIGINLGDVIEEDGRIYGDGVNIAARIESLAEKGGICISGNVFNHVKNKVPFRFEDQGEQSVKNIADPVQVYRIIMDFGETNKDPIKQKAQSNWKRNLVIAMGVITILLSGVSAIILFTYWRIPGQEILERPKDEYTSSDVSIAILPFVNMTGDLSDENICDGISENIITALSKVYGITVISRQSSFQYKGKQIDIKQISKDLEVRYVLEGSVQRSGKNIRITAQLIDASKGNHLWAESYDREMKDIFAIQDEITLKIVNALQVELTEKSQASAVGMGINSLKAYLTFFKARKYMMVWNKNNVKISRQLLKEAVKLDPDWAMPYGLLGFSYAQELYNGWHIDYEENIREALYFAEKAENLNDSLPVPHLVRSLIFLHQRRYEEAIAKCEKGISLGPDISTPYYVLGWVYTFKGEPEKAINIINKAISIIPKDPLPSHIFFGLAFFGCGQYQKAILEFEKENERNSATPSSLCLLLAAYSLTGKKVEAQKLADEVKMIDPNLALVNIEKSLPYKNQSDIDRIINELRKAGLK